MGAAVIEGDTANYATNQRRLAAQSMLQDVMNAVGTKGFASVCVANERVDGMLGVVQNAGIGALCPNTVLLAWPEGWQDKPEYVVPYVKLLKGIRQLRRSLIVLKGTDHCWWLQTQRSWTP